MLLDNIRFVIWDFNGTIFDDLHLCHEICNRQLQKRAYAGITMDDYRDTFCHPVQEFYRLIGVSFDRHSYDSLAAEFHADYAARCRQCGLHTGALELFEHLRSANIPQSVLSALPHETLSELLEMLGLNKYLEHVVGADNHHGRGKVEKARIMFEDLGVQPSELVFIGDTDHDAEVADDLGAHCLLVAGGFQSRRKLEATGHRVFGTMLELKDWLTNAAARDLCA